MVLFTVRFDHSYVPPDVFQLLRVLRDAGHFERTGVSGLRGGPREHIELEDDCCASTRISAGPGQPARTSDTEQELPNKCGSSDYRWRLTLMPNRGMSSTLLWLTSDQEA